MSRSKAAQSTGRDKDKVATAALLCSPQKRKDTPRATPSSDAKSAESQRSGRYTRLPQHVSKQLAEDIENNGGIGSLIGQGQGLSALLDCRPELYGKRGQPIRKKLQKKVSYWQELHKSDTYDTRVLAKYKVESAATRLSKTNPKVKVEDESSLSCSSYGSDSERSTSSIASTPAKPPAAKKHAVKRAAVTQKIHPPAAPTPTPRHEQKSAPLERAFAKPRMTEVADEIVEVNLERPERNGSLALVARILNIPGLDCVSFYHGFSLWLGVDLRFISDRKAEPTDTYRARIFDDNSVLITLPGWNY